VQALVDEGVSAAARSRWIYRGATAAFLGIAATLALGPMWLRGLLVICLAPVWATTLGGLWAVRRRFVSEAVALGLSRAEAKAALKRFQRSDGDPSLLLPAGFVRERFRAGPRAAELDRWREQAEAKRATISGQSGDEG
jgi:hypothetical protein